MVTRAELGGELRVLEIAAVTTIGIRAVCPLDEAVAELRALLARAGVVTPKAAAEAGRCRALTELAIEHLSARGVAIRYVAGYLLPSGGGRTDPHAWPSVELPGAGGVPDFDPSPGAPAGALHLSLARGAGHDDVAPVSGALAGRGAFRLESVVHVELLVSR